MLNHIKHVVVGISGGVDSAVSALLLKQRGFQVTGVFMKNWDISDETGFCTWDQEYEIANEVCQQIDVPLLHINFVKEYWTYVFSELLSDYETGYTPNPDILCNRHIKFDHFYRYATEHLNADAIATGHYASTSFGCMLENYKSNSNVQLRKSRDTHKDQTFFLSQIAQKTLQRTMFPVGNMTKNSVRELARANNLAMVANKPDSTGICFIGKRPFSKFITEYLPDKPGQFIDIDTDREIGTHLGLHHWTLGQRANLAGFRQPYFISKKEPSTNTIYLAAGTTHPSLYTDLFFTGPAHWIDHNPIKPRNVFNCEFRFQHTKPLIPCQIYSTEENRLIVRLADSVRALTPGQYAVFYLDNQCLGSARIRNSGPTLNYKS